MNKISFENKKVAVTGKFEELKRSDIELRLKALGAIISKTVSSKTDILVAGAKAGSKLQKAKDLNLVIMDEKALMASFSELDTKDLENQLAPKVAVDHNTPFSNKTVVLTGTFLHIKKKELQAKLEQMGANIASGVTKKTELLIVGREAGSKLMKGMQNKTKIIWEHELYELLGLEIKEEKLEGPLSDYLLRFYAMVDELMANDGIEIMYMNVSKPAKYTKASDYKSPDYPYLGDDFAPAISNFYKQTNGLALCWRYKGIKSEADGIIYGPSIMSRKDPYRISFSETHYYNGAICIQPIGEVFSSRGGFKYNNGFNMEEIKGDKSLEILGETITVSEYYDKGIKIFDDYAASRPVAFHTAGRFGGNPPVLVAEDYSGFEESYYCDFETYMEYKLANYCVESSIDGYYCGFLSASYNMGQTEPLHYPQSFWNKTNSYDLENRIHSAGYPMQPNSTDKFPIKEK